MPSSTSKSKPKPSEVASEAKRVYIPAIREKFASTWTTCSYIYQSPLQQITFAERPLDLSPPVFCECRPRNAMAALLTHIRCFDRGPGHHRIGLGRLCRVCHTFHLRSQR